MEAHRVMPDKVSPRNKAQVDDDGDEKIEYAAFEPMKITNGQLFDCLEKAFSHLNSIDLFNLSESNLLLREAAQMAYRGKVLGKVIEKVEISYGGPFGCLLASGVNGDLYVKGLKAQLRFIRYFGHLVPNLRIIYDDIPTNHRIHLEEYINEYCTDTLTELHLIGGDKNAMKYLKKPFTKVERLSIEACDMAQELFKWFPNLYHLELHGSLASRKTYMSIELSSHLRNLNIGGNWTNKFLLKIARLPNLESLSIRWKPKNLAKDKFMIHFESVRHFCIVNRRYIRIPIALLPMKFDQLESLEVSRVSLSELVKFMVKLTKPSIIKLTVGLMYDIFPKELAQLNEASLLLKELHINKDTISIHEVSLLTTHLTSLQTFCFRLKKSPDDISTNEMLERLEATLERKWKATRFNNENYYYFKLERHTGQAFV